MESGLIGLRAELQKKRAEADRFGPGQREKPTRREREATQPKVFSASNTGVSGRAARDEEQHQAEERTEEKARHVLERKAAMYDKIQQGTHVLEDDQLNQKYLVNFQKKIIDDVMKKKETREDKEKTRKHKQAREEVHSKDYGTDSDEDDWVEFTDAFGRTRECPRAELSQRLEQDKKLSHDLNPSEETEEKRVLDPHLLEDLHREALHQKWEAEEEVNASKKDLHYQDVLYNEARTHGPGFLKFSRDEKERKAQMELLRDLQTETKRAKGNTAAAASKKQKAMKSRLEKVRQRKRLKMGLPMKDDDRLKTPPGSEEEEEDEQVVGPAPLPPSPPPRKKVGGVREWDLGKEGVTSTLTQEEWVLRQRSQRSQEFAPPSSYYSKEGRSQTATSSSYVDQVTEDEVKRDSHSPSPDPKEPLRDQRQPEFAPPATHEYYGPMTKRSKSHHRMAATNLEAAITKGLSHLRNLSK